MLARLASLVKDGQKPEPKQQEQREELPPLYTEDEQKKLTAYMKDWPDVAEAEALRRKGEYRHLTQFVFAEVANVLKPWMDMVDSLAAKNQHAEIRESVPDYNDALADQVAAWVKTQPSYLQNAYNTVITSGTPGEVSDLITRFRKETGSTAPAQKSNGAPPPAKKATELPPATKQAAAALAPVSSKRSAISSGVDPNDFDGAFDQFAKQM